MRTSVGQHGRILEVHIDKVVAEGDGLGRDADGKVVFVEGALPGELVSAQVVAESKDYARATVLAVVEASDRRRTPPCPYVAHGCGGCDLQHASEELQRDIKASIVEESLRRIGGIAEPAVRMSEPIAAERGLRTTVRVASAGPTVGFRRRRSHDVVPIAECLVAHPRINALMSRIVLRLDSEAVIRVSESTGEAVVWVEPSEGLLVEPADVGVGVDATVHESVSGRTLQISAGSFFQSSLGAATALVDAVARALGPTTTWPRGVVIDAYGGVGLFAATVVPEDRTVVVLESNPWACTDARVNLAGRSAHIVEGRVEDWVPEPAAIVIADPAREGLRSAGVETLTRTGAEILVLVSCDPASLGRDTKLLTAAGYQLHYSEVLDVFAHTHHVETVSRFVRSSAQEVPCTS